MSRGRPEVEMICMNEFCSRLENIDSPALTVSDLFQLSFSTFR